MINEGKKGFKVRHKRKVASIEPTKPRNFVAKNAINTGAGAHKDKKKSMKQGDTKHKKSYAEGMEEKFQAQLNELNQKTKDSYKDKAEKQVKELEPHAKKGEYKDIAKRAIDRRKKGLARVAEGSLNELANTSLKVKEPKDFVNTNDRKQVTYKVMKFKSGKDTYLINFTVKGAPAFGKKSNWNAVNVAFGVKEKQDDYSFGDEMNTDLTGRNKNQFLIYSTVINTIRRFITEYNTEIDEIIMQGAGERQEAMYQRFFQSAGKYFPGWHYDGKHSLVRDVPRQKVKKVREQGVAEGWKGGAIGGAVSALAGPEAIPVGMAVGDKVGDWVGGKDMDEGTDTEGGMAKQQLITAAKLAIKLAERMEADTQLDAWVQTKISLASDYIETVFDFIVNGEQDVDKEVETDEEVVPGITHQHRHGTMKSTSTAMEGAKVDRQAKHITKSMMKAHPGMSKDSAEAAAWAHIKHPKKKKKVKEDAYDIYLEVMLNKSLNK